MKKQKNYGILYLILIFFSVSGLAKAQEISNAKFDISENTVNIYYDLKTDTKKEYEVTVVLKRKNQPGFILELDEATGNIGDDQYAGVNKKIVWKPGSKELSVLDGDDFYFEITAVEAKGSTWYYYVGGVVAGGVVAAVTLLNKKSTTSGSQSGETEIKNPPLRP